MDLTIFLVLLQDGLTNGAIYALLALSLVLVFAVTRVIFIPQGEFVAYGALTAAAFERGILPPTVWLLLALGIAAALRNIGSDWPVRGWRALAVLFGEAVVLPAIIIGASVLAVRLHMGIAANAVLSLAIVTLTGSYLYKLAFRPLERASTLTLLIAAVGVHLAMMGLGLVFFGAEGVRMTPYLTKSVVIGPLVVTGQSVCVLAASAMLSLLLFFGISRTLIGKALMATAANQLGARLSGISPPICGQIAFAMAAFIGALSGLLIAPMTTIYYDSGFIIGLKGFVAAIVGGLVSFPVAALAALGVGVIEAMASFTASAFKEVVVFLAIIPVLLLRSLHHRRASEEE